MSAAQVFMDGPGVRLEDLGDLLVQTACQADEVRCWIDELDVNGTELPLGERWQPFLKAHETLGALLIYQIALQDVALALVERDAQSIVREIYALDGGNCR